MQSYELKSCICGRPKQSHLNKVRIMLGLNNISIILGFIMGIGIFLNNIPESIKIIMELILVALAFLILMIVLRLLKSHSLVCSLRWSILTPLNLFPSPPWLDENQITLFVNNLKSEGKIVINYKNKYFIIKMIFLVFIPIFSSFALMDISLLSSFYTVFGIYSLFNVFFIFLFRMSVYKEKIFELILFSVEDHLNLFLSPAVFNINQLWVRNKR